MPNKLDARRWKFTVQFSGLHFPLDMLRYDNAWPATAVDAGKIESSFDLDRKEKPTDAARLVTLICAGNPPTSARWQSFTCKLGEVDAW